MDAYGAFAIGDIDESADRAPAAPALTLLAMPPASADAAAAERSSVLIVDDSTLNVVALKSILASEYDIYTARTGEEGVAAAVDKRPDIILLDVVMPGMSGFEALVKLKENSVTRNIPVIVITGLTKESDEEQGFLLGAVDYITKPFKSVIVKVRVRTHLQNAREMRVNEQLSMVDPLTSIPNRRGYNERVEMEWKRALREKQPVSFLMIDIDKFKLYNDTYGHLQGDEMLRAIAKVFVSSVHRPSDYVARLGGEEFCVLLPNTDLCGALLIAETIRANVEAARVPSVDGKYMTQATISVGAATTVPAMDESMEDLVALADASLYEAKKSGRNRVVGPRLAR